MSATLSGGMERKLYPKRGRPADRKTMGGSLSAFMLKVSFEALGETETDISWPSTKYRLDPIGFSREVLGVEPWPRQAEILEAVCNHDRVAVRSGHKVGKSLSAAIIALWWFCSRQDARVVMSSVTSRQVDQILWREVKMRHARAKIPIGGRMPALARTGLKIDFREIMGFTAREAEAVAGISGGELLYILDEASGIPESIFEAIEGNRAGGAKSVMFSNPTRSDGAFFDAFYAKRDFYHVIHVSAEETPNVEAGKTLIPGLATRDWVEEKRREWGEDSPLFKVRVRGEFHLREDGKILSVAAITDAEARWHETEAEGRLFIGIDPAGPGDGGDETVIALRRGNKITKLIGWQSIRSDGLVANIAGVVREERLKGERPCVVIDCLGPAGVEAFGKLRAEADKIGIDVFGIRASDRAKRRPDLYDRMRDELWANLVDWIRNGGAIPEETRLSKELHAPMWATQINGKLKVTPKPELRRQLGRSPDRADAVALACWVPVAAQPPKHGKEPTNQQQAAESSSMDPYDGLNVWR